jgi:hypothetical protein
VRRIYQRSEYYRKGILMANSWIEIELVDEVGNPVPGIRYHIVLSDGSTRSGSLGANGRAREDGIGGGIRNVSFPELDASAWGRE